MHHGKTNVQISLMRVTLRIGSRSIQWTCLLKEIKHTVVPYICSKNINIKPSTKGLRTGNVHIKIMPRHIVVLFFLLPFSAEIYSNVSAFPIHGMFRSLHLPKKSTFTAIGMILDIFNGGNDTKKLPQLPKDVKEAVARCREATQLALQDRVSRMDIEFPVGTKFGIEKGGNSKKKKGLEVDDNKPTKDDLDLSDRELARIFVEMFQPVGGNNIVVCFNDISLADAAKRQWSGDATADAQIMSMDRRKSLKKAKKAPKKGFAEKLAAEVDDDLDESGPFRLPSNTEVALFVAPGSKELVIVERICESVGSRTLVVLLNARLFSILNFGSPTRETLFRNEFQQVFTLSAASQTSAPGCLLHRTYGSNWILARKSKVGRPETLFTQETRPTDDECRHFVENLGPNSVDGSNVVENAVLSVTNWLR
jgi:hypothetical protein